MITEETKTNVSLPQRRTEEIEFYNYIRRMLKTYDANIVVTDIVDLFAGLGKVAKTSIQKIVKQIYLGDRSFVPSREEQIIVYAKKGYSFRKIRDITGIHPNTQYRILERMQADRTQIPTIAPRLDIESYLNIHAFMEQINKFKEI